jgi:hypothetical protein
VLAVYQCEGWSPLPAKYVGSIYTVS